MGAQKRGQWKKTALILGLTAAVTGGIVVVFVVFFPRLGNTQTCTDLLYVELGGEGRLLTLSSEYSHHEDYGTSMVGYELGMYVPGKEDAIGKLFIERSDPQTGADIMVTEDGAAWIVEPRSNVQTNKGYLTRVKLQKDGTMVEWGPDELAAYGVLGLVEGGYIALVNGYEERYCFDMKTHKISEGVCVGPEKQKAAKGGKFFGVRKTPESMRMRMWYAAPAGVAEEGAFDLKALAEDVRQLGGDVTDERRAYYEVNAGKGGYVLKRLSGEEYLENVHLLYEDSLRGIWVHGNVEAQTRKVLCMTREGKVLWDAPLPKPDVLGYSLDYVCLYKEDETVIVQGANWAMGMDNKEGRPRWSFVVDE